MAKKRKETIGIIKAVDLLKKSAPKADIPFKTGMHMTETRDKIYKKWNEKDDEANDSNNN
jgi:hypothetical protein